MIVALRSKYSPIICGPFNFDWTETVEDFRLKKWAYVEDLLPNMQRQKIKNEYQTYTLVRNE